MMKIYTKT